MEDNLNNPESFKQFQPPEEINQSIKDIIDSHETDLDNFYIPEAEHKSWSENFTNAVVEFGGSNAFIIIIAVILFIWILINAKLWTLI